jgi:hypothetical protein
MMRSLRLRRPSPAMIVAIAALCIALGGTAVAGGLIRLGDLTPTARSKTVGVGPLTYVTGPTVAVADGVQASSTAVCPSNLHVIGGGGLSSSPTNGEQMLNSSNPIDQADADSVRDDGWRVDVDNFTPGVNGETITAFAICAKSLRGRSIP